MRCFITARNILCDAYAPHKMPTAALNTTQGAAQTDLRHFIPHEIRPAVCRQHPNATACSPRSVRTRPTTIADRPMVPHRPHAAGLTSARIARPINPQIKKLAGTQTDPDRSANAVYVATTAAWRPWRPQRRLGRGVSNANTPERTASTAGAPAARHPPVPATASASAPAAARTQSPYCSSL